jgi:hypothetical protein
MFESETKRHFVYMWLETPNLYRENRSCPRLHYGQFHHGYAAVSEHLLTGRHSCRCSFWIVQYGYPKVSRCEDTALNLALICIQDEEMSVPIHFWISVCNRISECGLDTYCKEPNRPTYALALYRPGRGAFRGLLSGKGWTLNFV